MQRQSLKILGLMSGTSLDGLDLALCDFSVQNNTVAFQLLASKTFVYEPVWKERLQNAYDASAEQYFKLHSVYGEFISEKVTDFLKENNQTANYIASHGHTIFHRPQLGFTTQIGLWSNHCSKNRH
jgi:anhydro-N-acetylmuramic acid kinase